MDQGALVMDHIKAGADVLQDLRKLRPVRAAFWLKEAEIPTRYFYLVFDDYAGDNRQDVFGDVWEVTRRHRSIFFSMIDIRVVDSTDPLACDAVAVNERHPDPLGHLLQTQPFGETYVDQAYIYPDPISEATPAG